MKKAVKFCKDQKLHRVMIERNAFGDDILCGGNDPARAGMGNR
jgi:hypothetical protein